MKDEYWISSRFLRVGIGLAAAVWILVMPHHLTAQNRCGGDIWPEPVRQILKNKYSDWRPVNIEDLSAEHQQYWLHSLSGADCPGLAAGHFESKTSLSYALSLMPKQPGGLGLRIIVIRKGKGGIYQDMLLEKVDVAVNPYVVYSVPPGTYYTTEEAEKVQLELDGFQVERMEAAAVLYFWEKGIYRKAYVSN